MPTPPSLPGWTQILRGNDGLVEREQVFERLFAASPLAAAVVGPDGTILVVNQAFARLTGYARGELEGRHYTVISYPDAPELARAHAALEQLRRGESPPPFEKRYVRNDGATVWGRITAGPVCDAEGRFLYAVTLVEDVSERLRNERVLHESEERFRTLVELSPDAIFFFVGGLVAHANPAALRLLGAERADQVLGRASATIIHPDSIPKVEARVRAMVAGEPMPAWSDEQYVRLDGTPVDVEVTAAYVPTPGGKGFVVIVRDVRERRAAEARRRAEREAVAASLVARERERWLRQILDMLPSMVWARDAQGRYLLANRAYADAVGRTPDDIVGRHVDEVHTAPHEAPALLAQDREIIAAGAPREMVEKEIADARGRPRVVEGLKIPFSFTEGPPDAVLGVATDITARRQLERQLVQAQKLEGLGRLAGGVAHDFNNLLTVILEGVDHLARSSAGRRAPDGDGDGDGEDPATDIERIREAAQRAARLTAQLLAFARQSAIEPRVVSLDELVPRTAHLLARVLGEDVTVVTDLDSAGATVAVDPTQLEQVLMNLAVNARDAMPRGGTLTMATRRRDGGPRGEPGAWVELAVSDTGVGMSEATRARIFEPFFTTKEVGRGTGLGLAMCYGIVAQFGGRIDVESELGRGATFRIALPACAPGEAAVSSAGARASSAPLAPASRRPRPPSVAPSRGGETVLVLEDDPLVRNAAVRMLRRLGYTVLEAARPSEAIEAARTHPGRIDLLMTDVVMPEMNGVEAARAVRAIRPDTRVLYASGYSDDALPPNAGGEPVRMLSKPYTLEPLARALREALDAPPR